jgi:hypothetical protein
MNSGPGSIDQIAEFPILTILNRNAAPDFLNK